MENKEVINTLTEIKETQKEIRINASNETKLREENRKEVNKMLKAIQEEERGKRIEQKSALSQKCWRKKKKGERKFTNTARIQT
jgi:hypothetical protein